jgi:hypothetical protein
MLFTAYYGALLTLSISFNQTYMLLMEINGIDIDFSSILEPAGAVTKINLHRPRYIQRSKTERAPDKVVAIVTDGLTGYAATIGSLNYPLTDNSMDCRGHISAYIFSTKDNKYIRVLRDSVARTFSNKHYLPFKNKQRVLGRIVTENGTEKFELLVNVADYHDELSQNAAFFNMIEYHERIKRAN